MAIATIQGIECSFRDLRRGETILYENLPREEQYFRRIEHPFTDDDLEQLSSIPLLEDREKLYTEVQKKWVKQEKERMNYGEGVYAYINGVLTYLPASYWGYINHWVLEHGDKPEYREADRIFFLFMEYLYFETKVIGCTRGKGRRQGASSLGYFWMWWICGRNPEKEGGSISFNDEAAGNNFSKMFIRGFKSLLPCFVEDIDSNSDNFVRFRKPTEKSKKGINTKREGLNSYCGFLSNSINAYDSGRLSFGIFDEAAKYAKMNINTYWSKVSPTLKKGTKKLGFAYLPTTVNPPKMGGENYKQFWDDADQNQINQNTGKPFGLNTPHGVVRYFVPATEGYSGCIDKFGNSVIDDPVDPIMGNDGDWITKGARTIILEERALKKGEQLLEHRRDFPLDEFDMFSFYMGACEFNEYNVIKQLEWLKNNPVFLRRCRLVMVVKKQEEKFGFHKEFSRLEVNFMDDDKGGWLLYERPNKPNYYQDRGGHLEPLNKASYQIGVDTTKDDFAINGSKPTICVLKKSCIVEGEESGLYPVAFYDDKTRLDVHFDEEVLKACLWYGCTANYEIDARTDFYRFFSEKKAGRMLEWTPKIARDPVKRDFKIKPGTQSGDPFQLATQLQVAKMYIDGNDPDEYNGHVQRIVYPELLNQLLKYDHSARTPSDQVIALMMALLPIMGETQAPLLPQRKRPIIPTYKIKMR